MITTIEPMQAGAVETTDVALVTGALTGDRRAFERIVVRYQTLICSLAYSATGNLAQSEDVAQETFVTAWKELPRLRDHEKLRSWLCAIARFTISKALRKQGREPSHAAESLDAVAETSAHDAQPVDRMMSSEEQAILWRALERIPQNYREPLVLFYREHESIQAVASALELSEDAVKQRLARGRKLLHQEVLAIVEGGLARTAPGRAFTGVVLAALPAFLLPAQAAAAAGSMVAKGTAKGALGAAGVGSVLLGPVLAIFGTWVGYRMDIESAGSEMERELTKKFYRRLWWGLGSLFVAFALLMSLTSEIRQINELLLPSAFIVLGSAYALFIGALIFWWMRVRRTYFGEQPAQVAVVKPAWEYRSTSTLFGLPLVHIRIGGDFHANRIPVRAWIAVGDTAMGALFAFGGIAIAPISIGGCAIGLLPFGGATLGLVALGGLSVGIWSFGGFALGWQAFGGCAIGWSAALGGAAVAHDFALGGSAHAMEANNAAARNFFQAQPFFQNAGHVFTHYMGWLNLVWVVPMLVWWRLVRRAKA